jgi:mRNA interferase MazF
MISTVIAAVITSNLRLAQAPGTVILPKNISRLPRDSVVNVSQLVTLDRNLIVRRVSRLPEAVLFEIEEGIKLVLAL